MAANPHQLFSIEPLEELAPSPRPAPHQPAQDKAVGALMLGLKALSQGAIIAASRFTNLAMVISVFWLFMSIPNPSQFQIVWGGMYSAFILAALYVKGRS